MVAGILGIVGNLLGIVFLIVMLGAGRNRPGMPQVNVNGAELTGRIVGSVVGTALSGLLVASSLKMKRLESKGSAMTACILGMLPCGGCCLIGLPFGIWGLIALNNPDVKRVIG
jgi:hypothetical protein